MSSSPTSIAFAKIPVPALLLGPDGTLLAVNPAAARMVGRSADELLGRPLAAVMRADQPLATVLARADEGRPGDVVVELQFDGTDGEHTAECTLSKGALDGRPVLQVFAVDVTAYKRAAAAARAGAAREADQRHEILGMIAGGVAHDFNNLLVGVLAEASAAREEPTLPAETRAALLRIEAAAQRMANLTRQMLASAGRGRFVSERIDPDRLLREATAQLVRSARPEIAVKVTPGAAGVVSADPGLLRQVVVDLVANASEAGATTITVTSELVVVGEASWWQLEVADDGTGIAPQTLPRIFEPFFSTRHERPGLGLAAVHGIVRRLGGEIDVHTRIGRGARFRVRIPLVPGAEAPRRRAVTAPPSARLAGLRILVADDEPTVRATVQRLLERRGATVTLAPSGTEAEARLREGGFDLVVLDVEMPGRSGYDVLRIARALRPTMPVVLMSGYTEREREAGEAGPDAFLDKPFTARLLDATIDDVMRKVSRR